MEEIRLKARAKINLTLDVTGKRDNGYHELQMIMQTVGLYDEIVLRKIPENEIRLESNVSWLPAFVGKSVFEFIPIWLGVRQNSCAAPMTLRKAF